MSIVEQFLAAVRRALATAAPGLLPDALFATFDHTTTGSNEAHPRVWGACALAAWEVGDPAGIVEIDPRLNRAGAKFQPDILLRSADGQILLAVDIESPNSSDARLLPKDVDAFTRWADTNGGFPYVVVTMLPDRASANWQLRWRRGYNAAHASRHGEIAKNPFRYWYGVLANDRGLIERYPIHFANFDGRDLRSWQLGDIAPAQPSSAHGLSGLDLSEVSIVLNGDNAEPVRLAAAVALVERIGGALKTTPCSASGWPLEAPSSAWAEVGWAHSLGLSWDGSGRASISLWKGKRYAWPSSAGPARIVDEQGLRSRLVWLDTWWNGVPGQPSPEARRYPPSDLARLEPATCNVARSRTVGTRSPAFQRPPSPPRRRPSGPAATGLTAAHSIVGAWPSRAAARQPLSGSSS